MAKKQPKKKVTPKETMMNEASDKIFTIVDEVIHPDSMTLDEAIDYMEELSEQFAGRIEGMKMDRDNEH